MSVTPAAGGSVPVISRTGTAAATVSDASGSAASRGRGNERRVAATALPIAGRVIGLLGLVTVAVTGCGTNGSSSTPKVSVTAAAVTPCLLVSPGEAHTILGPSAVTSSLAPTGGGPAACSFGELQSPLTVILVHIVASPFAQSASSYITNPAPAGDVGHGAVCGPSPSLPDGSALVGPIGSDYSLFVDGLTSCATLEKFATVAYSHLQV